MEPVIETTHGKVRGKLRTTVYDDQFYCFDGIPYARPPVGAELRFKPPQPLAPWTDIRDCTETASKCIHYNRHTGKIEGSEDCLYLNIYAKKLVSDRPLPVMVYIHGGGFTTGDPSRHAWGPDYFMMKDIVFITIGFRLGALGFIPFARNAGIRDQIYALNWIKSNCLNFNGDPDNITLFGHSSGSSLVKCLLMSEKSKGLFHKAILMAGFCWTLQPDYDILYRYAKHVGYTGENNEQDIYNFLLPMEASKLVDYNFWTPEERCSRSVYPFHPHLESDDADDAIFTKKPIDMLATSWGNHIPIMLGGNSYEAVAMYNVFVEKPEVFEMYKAHPEFVLPSEVRANCDEVLQRELGEEIIRLHFGDKQLVVENIHCILDLFSYNMTYHSIHRFIHLRLLHSMAPTYLYRFDFDSPIFNLFRIKNCGPNLRGVSHVDELSYLFYMPESFKLDRDTEEFATIMRMIELWTSFACRGDPNTRMLNGVKWKPVERFGPQKCLNISNELTFIDFPESPKCKSWDKMYEKAGLKPY